MRTNAGGGKWRMVRAGGGGAACVAALLTSPVQAQEPADDPELSLRQELEEIVVTASHIRRRDGTTPTPVMTLTEEDFLSSGATNVASFINESPSFLPGITPAANDSSAGAGSAFLDLRALGPKRTLVLVNGRRHAPTTAGGSVDISVLPSVALERIETVTGGASAAWGSDAVAGVVNVIYDRDLRGLRTTAQYGAAEEGDGRDGRFALAAGEDLFGGRGHFLFAAEYQENSGVADQKDRDWGARRWGVIRNPLDAGPDDGVPARLIRPDANLLIATEGGLILGPGPIANLQFTPDGGLAPFEPGSIISPPYMIGGDGANFGQYAALSQPYERKNAFFAVDFDLTDNVRAFFEGGYARTDGHSDVVQSFVLGNLLVRADNAFIPDELRTLLQENGIPAFAVGRLNTDMGFIRTAREQEMRRGVLGLAGEFGASWAWETYVQYGEAEAAEVLTNNFMPGRFALAADAVRDADGRIVCRATLDPSTAAAAQGCEPINIFGAGAPSAAAIDYVSGTSTSGQEQSQLVAAADINGELWDLWAGPLSVAAGFEYREEEYVGRADPAVAAGEFLLGNGSGLAGEFSVKEVFGELLLPVLADRSFARKLEFSAAARLTDYDTIGSVETWKLGFVWDVARPVLVRASLSQDIRAPNIGELFAPQGVSFFTPVDPCDAASQAANPAYASSCAAAGIPADFAAANGLIRVITGGNPDLREETAETRTAGVIVTPQSIPGLQLSLDWYDIRLTDAIMMGVPVPTILDGCYGGSYPNSYCEGVQRDASGQLVSVASSGLNVAEFRNRGVDWRVSYGFGAPALFEDGEADVRMSVLGGYVIEQSDTRSLERIDRAGELRRDNSGLPELRWNANLAYTTDNVGLSAQVRYIGSGKYDNTYGPEDIEDNSIPAEWYLDLSARVPVRFGGSEVEFFVGVNNVFDEDPAIVPYEFAISALATNPGLYDTIGRYYYGGVRLRL